MPPLLSVNVPVDSLEGEEYDPMEPLPISCYGYAMRCLRFEGSRNSLVRMEGGKILLNQILTILALVFGLPRVIFMTKACPFDKVLADDWVLAWVIWIPPSSSGSSRNLTVTVV